MARITVISNLFDMAEASVHDEGCGKTVSEFLRSIRADEADYSRMVEVYDPERDATSYELWGDDMSTDMMVSISVNGREESPDYVIKETDAVSITILPSSKEAADAMTIIGGIVFAVGALLTFTGLATPVGLALMGGGALLVGAGIITGIVVSNQDSGTSTKKPTDDTGERNPSVKGSSNQSIVGSAYPLAVGDCTGTPLVVGSVYNEYDTTMTDPKDYAPLFGSKQKAYVLYAVGYGPLYIRNVYLDQLPLSRNPNHVLSGMLTHRMDSSGTVIVDEEGKSITFNGKPLEREIGQTWDGNKVRLEISQFGAHRSIYPYTVKQKKVDSAVLYCYDSKYQEVAGEKYITWQGGRFPTGLRTNTIVFSESVPYKVVVGLDFPSGLYREYTDNDGNFIYDKIPMNLVIQWRPVYKYVSENNLDSAGDADDVYDAGAHGYTSLRYSGWRNFDNLVFSGESGDSGIPGLVPKIRYWSHAPSVSRTFILEGAGGQSPAFKDGYYGYYKSRSSGSLGTASGEFVAMTRKRSIEEIANDYYPAEVEKYRKYGTETYKEWTWIWIIIPIPIYATKTRRVVTHEPTQTEKDSAWQKALVKARRDYDAQDGNWIAMHTKSACLYKAKTEADKYRALADEYWYKYQPEHRPAGASSEELRKTAVRYESLYSTANGAYNAMAKNDDAKDEYFAYAKYNHESRDTSITTFTSQRENALNKGLSASTSNDSNPNWNGIECFSFGPFSGGPGFYARTKADPSLTGVPSQANIEDAKNEMHFEVSATLSQEDILDLLNRNPMSRRLGKPSGDDYDRALIGKTDVELDGIQVRVVRLTPCYLDKVEGTGESRRSYSYSDVVKWDYLKTYCLDKQKLLDDIDKADADTGVAKIDCGEDTFDSFDAGIHEVPTWNTWRISDYLSTPLNGMDQRNLVTLGMELEPDAIGYIGSSIDKLNVDLSAVTPTLRDSYVRYWHKESGKVWYCDSYDTQDNMVPSLRPEFPGGGATPWEVSSEEEFGRWSPSPLLREDGLQEEGFWYSAISEDMPWLTRIFPAKVEKKDVIQPVSGPDGNLLLDDKGQIVTETLPQGNDWGEYARKLLSTHTDSAGRWIATDSMLEAFTGQNAVAQTVGMMIGSALGKDAYCYNSLGKKKFLRWWHSERIASVRYLYPGEDGEWYADSGLTQAVEIGERETVSETPERNGSHRSEFPGTEWYYLDTDLTEKDGAEPPEWEEEDSGGTPAWAKAGWSMCSESFFKAAEAEEAGDGYWWSMRPAKSSFNMLALRECWKYTDSIDVGGTAGAIRYRANGYITQQQKLNTLMSNMLVAARAFWTYDELGRYEFISDKPRKNPVLLITDEDCISSTNQRSFVRGIGGYHISFQDENNGFQNGEIYVLREGQSKDNPTRDIKDISIPFVTNPSQAWALGAFLLGQSITQREVWTRKLNHIGGSLSIGSLVEVQSSSLLIGTDHSGRIMRLLTGVEDGRDYIYGFLTDQTYDYRADYDNDGRNRQGVSVLQPASRESKVVTLRLAGAEQQEAGITVADRTGTVTTYRNLMGQTNVVLFERKISVDEGRLVLQDSDTGEGSKSTEYLPSENAVVAFGDIGTITKKAVVTEVQDDGRGHVSVTMYPYSDDIYSAGDRLPVYSAGVARKNRTTTVPIDMTPTRTEIQDALSGAVAAQSQVQGLVNGTSSLVMEPDVVTGVVAEAGENGIEISWRSLDRDGANGLRNAVQYYRIKIFRGTGAEPLVVTTGSTEYSYAFDRTTDGWPEHEVLDGWSVTVTAVNGYGKESPFESAAVYVGTDGYGTWLLGAPLVSARNESRTAMMTLSMPASADGRRMYGTIRYRVRVRRGALSYRLTAYKRTAGGASSWFSDPAYTVPIAEGSVRAGPSQGTRVQENVLYGDPRVPSVFTSDGESFCKDVTLLSPYTGGGSVGELVAEYVPYPGTVVSVSEDAEWYKPAERENPYESEDNYRAASQPATGRWTISGGTYMQKMPLYGESKEWVSGLIETPYLFDVQAFNEAGEGPWTSETEDGAVSVTADLTNLADFVRANETAKSAYISELSAITANLGTITGGTFSGNELNYWRLTGSDNPQGPEDYQGAFRVGGHDEYLQVLPVVNSRGQVTGYRITFKVGNFEVSSAASSINGELIVQSSDDAVDRTRITPGGTLYEHRDSPDSGEWYAIAKQETSGLMSSMLYSEGNLVVTNMGIPERRREGYDIGRPLPSPTARVYHFDTDMNDEKGIVGYELTSPGEAPSLVDGEDSTDTLDFTPAILAVAPYSEIGRSLYGQYCLTHPLGGGEAWTADFWMEYVWAEGQTLFVAGDADDRLSVYLYMGEPTYNTGGGGEIPPYNAEAETAGMQPYNVALQADTWLVHDWKDGREVRYLADYAITLEAGRWTHFAVSRDGDTLVLRMNMEKSISFVRRGGGGPADIAFNPSMYSLCLDELMVDSGTAISDEEFYEGSSSKIPWASLDYRKQHFVLAKSEETELHTNLFSTSEFRSRVLEILDEWKGGEG